MARIDLQFPPERSASSRIQKACAVSTRRTVPLQLLNVSGLALIAALAIAPPSFGQRGSPAGGGGGGGSHAAAAPSGGGGSHSGGGGSGGGAARSSGGGNASHGGAVRGGSHWGGNAGGSGGETAGRGHSGSPAGGARGGAHWAGSNGSSQSNGGSSASQPGAARGVTRWVEPPEPVSASASRDSGVRVGANGTNSSRVYDGAESRGAGSGVPGWRAFQPNSRPQPTGFRAAIRRFFGIRSASPAVPTRLAEGNPGNPGNTPVSRSSDRSRLPPVFNHIRLRSTPAAPKLTGSSTITQFSFAALPQPGLRHRPKPPFPRRFQPVYGGGYYLGYGGYSPGFWFGFPFYFGFDYLGSSAPCAYHLNAAPTMFLYLTDGSAVEVTDYWVDGDTLYYTTESGSHGNVLVSDIDLQRTSDANARLGFRFTLDRTQPGLPLDRLEAETLPGQPDQPDPPADQPRGNGSK